MTRLTWTLLAATLASPVIFQTVALAAPWQEQSAPAANDANHGNVSEGRRAADPDQQVKHLTKRLNLTADQQSQLRQILTDRASQTQALRQDTSLQPSDRRTRMQSLRHDTESKIEAVLNDEQKVQYQQMKAEMRERWQNHHQESSSPQQ